MTSRAAQYLNEIVSLTIMFLMVLALISGQTSVVKADSAVGADDTAVHDGKPRPLERVVDASIDPIASVLILSSGRADRRGALDRTTSRRPATR